MRTTSRLEARKRIEKVKTLPLMNTDDADLRTGEKTSPRINTDETDLSGGMGKICRDGGEWFGGLRQLRSFDSRLNAQRAKKRAVAGARKSTPIEAKMLKYTPIWDDLG